MKKLLYILIFAFILTACSNAKNVPDAQRKSDNAIPKTSADNSFELIKEKGKLIIGVFPSFAPMVFINGSGELDGFDIDLAKEVAQSLGVDAEFVKLSQEKLMSELTEGKIDLVWSGLLVNPENEEKALLSKPYLKNNIVIISNDIQITGIGDLDGKKIGIADNKINSQTSELKEIRFVKYKNNKSLTDALSANKITAAIIDENYYKYYAHTNAKSFNVLSGIYGNEEYAVAAKQGNTALMVEVDAKIQQLADNGNFARLTSKWFGNSKNK